MNAGVFIAELRAQDIHVWSEDGQLKVNAKAGLLTPELTKQLRQNKSEILDFLTGPAPLSFAQQRLWFLDQVEMVKTTYLIPYALEVQGPLEIETLRASLNALVTQQRSLRTTFPIVQGKPVQRISETNSAPLEVVDLSHEPGKLNELMNKEMQLGFDLSTGPLFKVVVYRLDQEKHVIFFLQHHIVSDAWSLTLMINKLGQLYNETSNNQSHELPELPIQFTDYSRWLRNWMRDEELEKQLEYWRTELDGAPQVLNLPTDRPRPGMESHRGANYCFDMAPEVRDDLNRLCRSEGVTLFMVLLAAFDILLLRHTGQDDVLVGVPIANRDQIEFENLIGLFVNTLIVRNDLSGDPTIRELLQRVQNRCLNAYAHSELPVEVLVEHMEPDRDLSRNPLFQVMLVLENESQQPTFDVPELKAKPLNLDRGATHIDLTFYIDESAEKLTGIIEYATDMYDELTIARMAEDWKIILQSMARYPNQRLSRIRLLSSQERHKLLRDWNATAAEYPRAMCLQDLVEAQAARTPTNTAVKSGATALTYAELEADANRFAQAIRARGIGRGDRVGICLKRDTNMLAVALGVLKAGAAYVPLDPSFPEERLSFMAEDARLALLVSTSALVGCFPQPREQQLLLDGDAESLAAQPCQPLSADAARDAQPEDAAYLIYTSGSTGKPKGVVVPHRAVVNFLNSMAQRPGLTDNDVLIAVTTLSFDIAVLELYLPLMVGATVVIASRDEAMDGDALMSLIEQHGAKVMQATPITWRLLLEAGWTGGSAFKALVGGEALPKDLADQLLANGVELWNMYGPTETTVWSTCSRITGTDNGITIGTPIDNTTVYILDAHKNLCPIGVPGELYIGGDGVTLGYWQRPELTADRFITDPFYGIDGATMYGTGDKARWLNDGTIQHLGRLDDQVKIRGYRVELGEIEARIAEQDEVSKAAVHLWECGEGDVRIVACCVPKTPGRLPTINIRKKLRLSLPDYMMPQYFLPVEEIPLTPNGKVDRKKLPTPNVADSSADEYEAPGSPEEIAIAEIWTDLIKPARPIGRNDKFFDMGGHSLLALRALRKMEQTTGTSIDFRVLFQQNLAEIAARAELIDATVATA